MTDIDACALDAGACHMHAHMPEHISQRIITHTHTHTNTQSHIMGSRNILIIIAES